MPDVYIELEWWPPSPDEPIGDARARELVRRLREIAPPVVAAAEADLRRLLGPTAEIIRSGAPRSYFARTSFSEEMRSLCVGVVYQAHSGDALQNSIQLYRNGVLSWRRDGT